MKLLIIAGPYEADRLRKTALAAGFEAVAIGPSESLTAWITAIRPDGIVVVPQAVSPDPAAFVANVRAVPRGQVPVFLVGDPEEEAFLRPLANGFLVRPVTPVDLLRRAREAIGPDAPGAVPKEGGAFDVSRSDAIPQPVQVVGQPVVPRPGELETAIFDALTEDIDADFDAEIRDVVRTAGAIRRPVSMATPMTSPMATPTPVTTAPPPDRARPSVTLAAPRSPSPSPASLSQDEVELDLPSLLARMFLAGLSGRLTLTHGNAKKHIIFDNGHPVLAGSALPEDRMGEMLVRQGRFSAEQLSSCSGEVTSGRRLGAVLVDHGLVKEPELGPLVRHHYEDVMYSLFNWDRGAWNLGTDNSVSTENILLSQHPAALILEGIRRTYSAERALAGLGGAHRVLRLRLTTGAPDLLENMGISSEERNLILLFDGLRGLDEIQSLTGAPPERLYGVAWALHVLQRLEPVDGTGRELSGATRTKSSVSPERDRILDEALVEARHELVVDGDYFQILGVSRDAAAAEIRRAYEARMAELAPEALHPVVAAERELDLIEMRAVLAEAARLLADEGLRTRYRDHLPSRSAGAGAGAGARS